MTVIEVILGRMRQGATLLAIGNAQRDANGNVDCTGIVDLFIVLPDSWEIPLPVALLPELLPYLEKAPNQEKCAFVYVLRTES